MWAGLETRINPKHEPGTEAVEYKFLRRQGVPRQDTTSTKISAHFHAQEWAPNCHVISVARAFYYCILSLVSFVVRSVYCYTSRKI